MTERIKLFSNPPPSWAEIQAHFDAHPELWDPNHPDFGKGPLFVDYITTLPLTPRTAEQKEEDRKMFQLLKEFASQQNIILSNRY